MSSVEEIESYKFQLEQVELALQADPENEELLKLKTDLKDLISMFETTVSTENIKKNKKNQESKKTVETALKLHEFSVDQEVSARWSGDGQFYRAIITAIGGADQVFSVKFKGYNDVEFVKYEDIKPIKEPKKRTGIFENVDQPKKKNKSINATPIPTITPITPTTTTTAATTTPTPSKKKVQTTEFENKKNAWLNFATGSTKKKSAQSAINKKSIFKTPDNPEGKVGVIGSGKGMTSFQQRGKHIYAPSANDEQ